MYPTSGACDPRRRSSTTRMAILTNLGNNGACVICPRRVQNGTYQGARCQYALSSRSGQGQGIWGVTTSAMRLGTLTRTSSCIIGRAARTPRRPPGNTACADSMPYGIVGCARTHQVEVGGLDALLGSPVKVLGVGDCLLQALRGSC